MTSEKRETPPEMFVRFTGMKAAGDFDTLPALGDRQSFTVLAECVKEPHHELMADGHRRPVIGMRVLEVEPGDVIPRPEGDPALPFDEDTEEIG